MPGVRTRVTGRLTKAVYWSVVPWAVLIMTGGCVSAPATGAPSASPGAFASPVASPSAVASAPGSNGAAPTPVLPPATVDISPPQVQVGTVMLSMALEPARHMLAQAAAMTSDQDPAHQATAGDQAPAATALVLDGLLKLTNNLDPSQPAPADLPDAMIRHANVQVRSNDGGYAVPYLAVSMDLLLDGRPMTSGLPVEPMVAAESTTPQMYYGNNLKLTQRGTYQVFIRLQSSALLGKAQPQAAQFNVVVR
jgi:hypothetical protein